MNLEGVTLKLLLEESDKEKALQIYSELRHDYFSSTFASILSHVNSYYDHYGYIPSLSELKVYRNRDSKVTAALSTVELLNAEGIDIYVAIEELANQYAQNQVLEILESLLDKIVVKDRYELLDSVSSIPLKLEEKLKKSNKVYSARDISVFKAKDSVKLEQVPTGISDEWDYEMGGYYIEDLILLGGKRGSGKSIVCANLIANQHRQGKPSMYFTIEMTYEETYNRIISILSEVPFKAIKQQNMTPDQVMQVAKTMASMFEGGDALYEEYFTGTTVTEENTLKFQSELQKLTEKEEGRIIIVDDRDLSIGSIDTQIATYKSRYGSDLRMVVVDYLNQVVIEGSKDMYDWKDQVTVSKYMKNLARKHRICMVSPYQIDDSGKARFSKGILDAADTAQIIFKDPEDPEHIIFITDKMRGAEDTGKHKVKVNWNILAIDPRSVPIEDLQPKSSETSDETATELHL